MKINRCPRSPIIAIVMAAFTLSILGFQSVGGAEITAWGDNSFGQTNVPVGLGNAVAIAAGAWHSLALTGLPLGVAKPEFIEPAFLVGAAQQTFYHRVLVKNGASSYGAVGLPAGLVIDSATGLITGLPAAAGTYA